MASSDLPNLLPKHLFFFDKKLDKSFYLCVNYWDFNNITFKNQYSLLLISNLLNWIGKAKRFTQLDLTNTYY